MPKLTTILLTTALATGLAVPALATTEQECEDAVAATQRDMEGDAAVLMQSDSIRDGWNQRLLTAAGHGQQGDPAQCVEEVKMVRSEAGLPDL